MFFIFRSPLTQRAGSFVRFLIQSHVAPCFYCQSMIAKSQFCHGSSVPGVGDLVKVILTSIISYEHIDIFTKKRVGRRDLGNRASPVT